MNIKKIGDGYSMQGNTGRIDIYKLRGWHVGVGYRDVFHVAKLMKVSTLRQAWYEAYRLYRMGY